MTRPNGAIWRTCSDTQDAAAKRSVATATRLRAAAKQLGFTENPRGRGWVHECPHCKRKVLLFASKDGIGADGACLATPAINQWLREEGFQS